jgi:hypothetical protein
LTKVTAAIQRETSQRESRADRNAPSPLRPGWVSDLVVQVLVASDTALSPNEVHGRAEFVHQQPLSRSSIRNALRIASSDLRRTRPSSAWDMAATESAHDA